MLDIRLYQGSIKNSVHKDRHVKGIYAFTLLEAGNLSESPQKPVGIGCASRKMCS